MNNELVDVVDGGDQVIGVVSRQVAHEQELLHRIAAVFVFDDAGRLVVQVRKADAGMLDHSVGGHVASGESYCQAAVREAAEELSVHEALNFVGTVPVVEHSGVIHLMALFWCRAGRGWTFVANDEVDEVQHWEVADLEVEMEREPLRFAAGFIAAIQLWGGGVQG